MPSVESIFLVLAVGALVVSALRGLFGTDEEETEPASVDTMVDDRREQTREHPFEEMSASDEEKEAWVREQLEPVAEELGGKIIRREDPEWDELSLELQFEHDGRPVRVIHEVGHAVPRPSVEMGLDNRHGMLTVQYEQGASPRETDPDDMFADEERDVRHFVADEVFIDLDVHEPAVFEELPERSRNGLVSLAREVGYVIVTDSVEFTIDRRIDEMEDYVETIREYTRRTSELATGFEEAVEMVGDDPGGGPNVYIGGEKVESADDLTEHGNVELGDDVVLEGGGDGDADSGGEIEPGDDLDLEGGVEVETDSDDDSW